MSVVYETNKCNYISFVKDVKYIDDKYKEDAHYLGFNENDTIDQIKTLPKEFTLIINTESKLFNDVEFEVNQDHVGENSKKHKNDQDINQQMISSANQLEAFSNNKFTIVPGKRSANIHLYHPKQNHDVIDSIARNGLMVTPKVSTEISVGKLFNILCTKKSFNLIMVNKNLEVSIRESKYPNDYVEPAYTVGKGEIVTVFYRYICLYFFGYTSVSNENDRDRIYDL